MLDLYYSFSNDVEKAYIITIKGNRISEELSAKCQVSCITHGQPFEVWDAYDGTSGKIIEPSQVKDDTFMSMVKLTNHYMSTAEVACALSHISLWSHCIRINKPIVILEHDATLLRKVQIVASLNSITYLGCQEWKNGWDICPIPPFGSEGPNNRFILRAHAYAIDPLVAKNLCAAVLKLGIYGGADTLMRADMFNISHQGFCAIDHFAPTTIQDRTEWGHKTISQEKIECM